MFSIYTNVSRLPDTYQIINLGLHSFQTEIAQGIEKYPNECVCVRLFCIKRKKQDWSS